MMAGVLGGLVDTGRAGLGLVDNVGNAISDPSGLLEISKVGQSVGDIFAGAGGTAVDIAKNGRVDILIKSTNVVGGFGGVISAWGAINDVASISKDYGKIDESTGRKLGLDGVGLSNALSLTGNVAGFVGGGVLALVAAGVGIVKQKYIS